MGLSWMERKTNPGVQENTKPVRTLESRVEQLYLNNYVATGTQVMGIFFILIRHGSIANVTTIIGMQVLYTASSQRE